MSTSRTPQPRHPQPSTRKPATAQISPFHRVAIRSALSAGALLGLGLGIAAVPSPANAATPVVHPDKKPDFDHDALAISTVTDTLPEDQAAHYEAIAGDTVQRVYFVHNRGLLPLDNVTVNDPDANGAVHCGFSGTPTIATILPLGWATCTATFTARPGEHDTPVTASGTVFLFNGTATDQDHAAYAAVVPALNATLSLNGGQPTGNLPAGSPVSAVVTVINNGNVALTHVTVLAPQPPLSIFGCGSDASLVIDKLNPGESVFCPGALLPAAGTHTTSVTITGEWTWDRPITTDGPQDQQTLTVQTVASAQYTGVPVTNPPPPPPPPPSTPAPPPPPTPAPPQPSLAFVPPPPPSPSPSPSPRPSRNSTPALVPAPGQLQAVSQFRASRQLPLPLKVLVIIIVPVVAAAAGAHRISTRR